MIILKWILLILMFLSSIINYWNAISKETKRERIIGFIAGTFGFLVVFYIFMN